MVLSGHGISASEAVANGFALATASPGRALDDALVLAEQMAVHATPALVANKRLLRQGWAEALAQTWDRERAAMLDMAEQVGPIGWTTED